MSDKLLSSCARILGISPEEIVKVMHSDRQLISGWDSLAHIQLYVAASEFTGAEIDFGSFMKIRRLVELLALVSQNNENSS